MGGWQAPLWRWPRPLGTGPVSGWRHAYCSGDGVFERCRGPRRSRGNTVQLGYRRGEGASGRGHAQGERSGPAVRRGDQQSRGLVVRVPGQVDRRLLGRLVRAPPGRPGHGARTALGEALTNDGRYLVVADQSGVDVIDVGAATRGDPSPIVGILRPPAGGTGDGAIEVAVFRDDRYVFVTRENDNDLAVFDLGKARLQSSPSAFVGP